MFQDIYILNNNWTLKTTWKLPFVWSELLFVEIVSAKTNRSRHWLNWQYNLAKYGKNKMSISVNKRKNFLAADQSQAEKLKLTHLWSDKEAGAPWVNWKFRLFYKTSGKRRQWSTLWDLSINCLKSQRQSSKRLRINVKSFREGFRALIR